MNRYTHIRMNSINMIFILILIFIFLWCQLSLEQDQGPNYSKKGYDNSFIDTSTKLKLNNAFDERINLSEKLYNEGYNLLRSGRNEEAIELFNRSLEICPSTKDTVDIESSILGNKGVALRRQNRYNEAIICYNEAIRTNEFNKDFYYNRGVALLFLGRYDEAKTNFLKSIELDPNNNTSIAQALNNIGVILYNEGKYEESIKTYQEALENDSSYSILWYNIGLAFYKTGKLNDAIEAYDQAINRDPKYRSAWINRGIAKFNLGLYGDAILSFGKAREIDIQDPIAPTNIGLILAKMGKYNESIKFFEEAIQKNRSYTYDKAYFGKGIALAELGKYNKSNYDEAIKAYDNAIKLNGSYSSIWIRKGNTQLQLGQSVEALESFEKALNVDPRNEIQVWKSKGDALYQLGIYDEAILAYHRSRDMGISNENKIRDFSIFLVAYCSLALYIFYGRNKNRIFKSLMGVNILGFIAYSWIIACFFAYDIVGLILAEGFFVVILAGMLWMLFGPVGEWRNKLSFVSCEFELDHNLLTRFIKEFNYIPTSIFILLALIANLYSIFEWMNPMILRTLLFSIILISLIFTLPPIIHIVLKCIDNSVRNIVLIFQFGYLGNIALLLSWLLWCYGISGLEGSKLLLVGVSIDVPILVIIMAGIFIFTFFSPYLIGWKSAKNSKKTILETQIRMIDQLSRITKKDDLKEKYSDLEDMKDNIQNHIMKLKERYKLIDQYDEWDKVLRKATEEKIMGNRDYNMIKMREFRELIYLDPRFEHLIFLRDLNKQIQNCLPDEINREREDTDISKKMNSYLEKDLAFRDKFLEELVSERETRPQLWVGLVSIISPILGPILSGLIVWMGLPVSSIDFAKIISDTLLNAGIIG